MGALFTVAAMCSGHGVMGDRHCECDYMTRGNLCNKRVYCTDHGHWIKGGSAGIGSFFRVCKCDPGWDGELCGHQSKAGHLDAQIYVLRMLLCTRALILREFFAEFRITGIVVVHGRNLRKAQ